MFDGKAEEYGTEESLMALRLTVKRHGADKQDNP
jgi:hypothetical protein